MEKIVIKHKEFEILELISNNMSKCSYKNKTYLLIKLDVNDSFYRDNLSQIVKLCRSAVKQPKLFLMDKKQGYVVREFLNGTSLFDYILDNDFNESIYKQVFTAAYYARIPGLNLNFDLKSWLLVGNELYYVDLFSEKYIREKDFTKTEIRKWFLSDELAKYYEKNGVIFDKTRIKNEYSVNKEMVLMTCKYYL